jgi:hypothetical protein
MKLKHRYAMKGMTSRELISYRGAIIVHDNRHEMEWLHQKSVDDGIVAVVEISARLVSERPVIRLRNHPDYAGITFPIDRDDFRVMGRGVSE